MESVQESSDFSFAKEEEKILAYWDAIKAFEGQLDCTKDGPPFVFYDGPPFATGLPHYGHLLAGTIKDIITRYASACGYHAPRRFGWDCHGLPVENEVNKKLGIHDRNEVLKMGIAQYNAECRDIVMKYSQAWQDTIRRSGRWIDFKNDYKTLDLEFMESVWWVFGQVFKKGLVYKGVKVMPYCCALGTSISSTEASENYKYVSDPSVLVSFPLDDDEHGAEMVAWTTTPWTLPSNLALCVHPDLDYVKVRDPSSSRVYVVAECRLESLPASRIVSTGHKRVFQPTSWPILEKFRGEELANRTYEPIFGYFKHLKQRGAYRVISDRYVEKQSGTGVVHQAPFFGEEDMRVCLANKIIDFPGPAICVIDSSGRYTNDIKEFSGRLVKKYDRIVPIPQHTTQVTHTASKDNPDFDIIEAVRAVNRLIHCDTVNHMVPFCPRTDTPLIFKAVDSWFIRIEHLRERLWANSLKTNWVPNTVRDGRFYKWLNSARDWAISRSRFWGTPIPIWTSEDGTETVCVASLEELKILTGVSEIQDMHRHTIDQLTIPSRHGKGVLRRVDDVFDCWFESGSMPFAQLHYPFRDPSLFQQYFPADFIAEGIDQTRGWVYSMTVISTILLDQPAYRNFICNGMVLAEDGRKMSKSLKNYPDPQKMLDKYGADAVRLYLVSSGAAHGDDLSFREQGVFDVVRHILLPWYNAYRFLVENVAKYEKDVGTSFSVCDTPFSENGNPIDSWLITSIQALVKFVRSELDDFHVYRIGPRLAAFIDDLTKIYIRYTRKRFKGCSGAKDRALALETLYSVLFTLTKLMAPFTPFLCETMYQNLQRASTNKQPKSVHWCGFPDTSKLMGKTSSNHIDQMRRVIELVRKIRDKNVLPLKQPVQTLMIVHPDRDITDALAGDLAMYLHQEANCRKIVTSNEADSFTKLTVKPNFSSLGKRYKSRLPEILSAIRCLTRDDIVLFTTTGSLTVAGHCLGLDDLQVTRSLQIPREDRFKDVDFVMDGQLIIILSVRKDKDLESEGVSREIQSRVSKLRKDANLIVGESAEVWCGMNTKLYDVLRERTSTFKNRAWHHIPLAKCDQFISENASSILAHTNCSIVVDNESHKIYLLLMRQIE